MTCLSRPHQTVPGSLCLVVSDVCLVLLLLLLLPPTPLLLWWSVCR